VSFSPSASHAAGGRLEASTDALAAASRRAVSSIGGAGSPSIAAVVAFSAQSWTEKATDDLSESTRVADVLRRLARSAEEHEQDQVRRIRRLAQAVER
jgi:hypothetical protein